VDFHGAEVEVETGLLVVRNSLKVNFLVAGRS
jgi:hypothetical protein